MTKKKIGKEELRELIVGGITSIELNAKYDYSGIIDMSELLHDCTTLESIPKLDTSQVTNMNYMFYECTSLKEIPKLVTSKVETMCAMFNGCSSLNQIQNLDISKVKDASWMFADSPVIGYFTDWDKYMSKIDTSFMFHKHKVYENIESWNDFKNSNHFQESMNRAKLMKRVKKNMGMLSLLMDI